ncbi:MAG: UDP-3-O-(3-hydroxymyristoyl)glucosamine N-acyltransferase [Pseudohongiella sp.]|nr:UDP-3-O-(3-hydroxymyristoyl)glucosamine N-acyltransferase [Pseudohongiella sp.]
MKVSFTLAELSAQLNVPVRAGIGAASNPPVDEIIIDGLATLENASATKLSFLSNPRYSQQLSTCQAGAVIIHPDLAGNTQLPCLLSSSPYVTYAKASQLFAAAMAQHTRSADGQTGIHASAVISPGAVLGKDVCIGPHAVIEAGVSIGDGSFIGAGCFVGARATIGNHCVIYANATVYHEVVLGDRVIVHASAVLGADGFGFAFDGQRSVKIAQLGAVRIGSDVEIGASSSIDRGALDDTVVGDGVKIDNQVQIGHNCIVGDHTVICGCSALAGSTRIGRYCVIGGGVGITGHLSIADRVTISAMSMVTQSITKPGLYSSGTLLQESAQWKRNVVTLGKLSELSRTVRNIQRQLDQDSLPPSGNDYDEHRRD